MAVALVSTGVQFPDNSIQTTAAASSGGASDVGSVITNRYGIEGAYAANASKLISNYGLDWTTILSTTQSYPTGLSYSNFYGGWVGLAPVKLEGTSSTAYQCAVLSKDGGISWVPLAKNPNTSYSIYHVAVDDSNGRVMYAILTGYQAYVLWQDYAGSTSFSSQLVADGTDVSQSPQWAGLKYVTFGTAGAAGSGMLLAVKQYSSGQRIWTASPGGTTFTLRVDTGYPNNNNYGGVIVWNPTFNRAVVINRQTTLSPYQTLYYSAAGNIHGTWTAYNATNTTYPSSSYVIGNSALSGTHLAYPINSNTLRYTSDFSTWSTTSPVSNLDALINNGSKWLIRTSQGLYYTNDGAPTNFTGPYLIGQAMSNFLGTRLI